MTGAGLQADRPPGTHVTTVFTLLSPKLKLFVRAAPTENGLSFLCPGGDYYHFIIRNTNTKTFSRYLVSLARWCLLAVLMSLFAWMNFITAGSC